MAASVLVMDTLQKNTLDAGFVAAFDGEPTRYFSAPGRTEIGGNHTDHQRGRVHGGGFAGTVQAFVPFEILEDFLAGIDSVLGEGACHVLNIRPQGGVPAVPAE